MEGDSSQIQSNRYIRIWILRLHAWVILLYNYVSYSMLSLSEAIDTQIRKSSSKVVVRWLYCTQEILGGGKIGGGKIGEFGEL